VDREHPLSVRIAVCWHSAALLICWSNSVIYDLLYRKLVAHGRNVTAPAVNIGLPVSEFIPPPSCLLWPLLFTLEYWQHVLYPLPDFGLLPHPSLSWQVSQCICDNLRTKSGQSWGATAPISSPPHKGKVKVARTRLPRVVFRSWTQYLAVSLQETWAINRAVGCHYLPPGPQLPLQLSRGLLPVSHLGEQRHDGCKQFA